MNMTTETDRRLTAIEGKLDEIIAVFDTPEQLPLGGLNLPPLVTPPVTPANGHLGSIHALIGFGGQVLDRSTRQHAFTSRALDDVYAEHNGIINIAMDKSAIITAPLAMKRKSRIGGMLFLFMLLDYARTRTLIDRWIDTDEGPFNTLGTVWKLASVTDGGIIAAQMVDAWNNGDDPEWKPLAWDKKTDQLPILCHDKRHVTEGVKEMLRLVREEDNAA